MLRDVCQYMIRNIFFESERISLQRIKPEFPSFSNPTAQRTYSRSSIEKDCLVFDDPAENRGARGAGLTQKAAISRLYRSKSVANGARAFYSTLNHRHRIRSI